MNVGICDRLLDQRDAFTLHQLRIKGNQALIAEIGNEAAPEVIGRNTKST
jgi:hypothetical protein